MNYLFLGEQSLDKDRQLKDIKEQLFPTREALELDYEILHASRLDPATLKKALLALPAVAAQRLVVVRHIQKLSPHNKKIILAFCQEKRTSTVLVLDSDDADTKNSFIQKLTPFMKRVQTFTAGPKQNVFAVTRAMTDGSVQEALKILNGLYDAGNHPLMILGGLVWFWGQCRSRLEAGRFQQGLKILGEADLNVKRSRLKAEHAVEVSVVKLAGLLNRS